MTTKKLAEINRSLRRMIVGISSSRLEWFLVYCGYTQREIDTVDLKEAAFAEVEIPITFDVESVHAAIVNIIKLYAASK